MPWPSSERLRPSRIGSIVQIPNPMRTRSGMKLPRVWYTVRPSTRKVAVDLLTDRRDRQAHRAPAPSVQGGGGVLEVPSGKDDMHGI
jgi:hypothetical protein